ncbi:5-oxoprolinase subunit B/C family protein [Bifidobacterium platyrrhinorum]|uniref:Carboxyltransferase domain-containing protein n=1 Tax=Bifidobacterium platyrrhinorum TaxID=2661628 RepID=A0A6L9SRU1_9BIFI|nr:urea amidolyase family protein [Bifidobacterium platyrrhinorum]NEG55287.1 carboxyltransferase domain-containing protein [Bifidobacterium platyrrhinorum]
MRFLTCGESAMIVECADLDAALRLYTAIDAARAGATGSSAATVAGGPAGDPAFRAITQLLPAARTVYVAFDPLLAVNVMADMTEAANAATDADNTRALTAGVRDFRAILRDAIAGLRTGALKDRDARIVEIPVTYAGEDLDDVAELLGVSADEVVARHSGHPWTVAFGGFAPGFDYLTGGDPIFDVPRRSTPRVAVPAGSVGLAGTFSGVYPRASSGGWQLIGTTTAPMWDDAADPPALLRPGDTVRFTPVRARATVHDDSCNGLQAGGAHGSDEDPEAPRSASGAPQPRSRDVAGGIHRSPALEVANPGILTTIQDDGRNAPDMGVTGSGAADPAAFHLANELVGNPSGAPAVELTGGDASFTAHGDLTIAVTGAPAAVTITAPGAEPFAVTRQEAFLLRDGETVAIGAPAAGLRDYVAVRGGFAVRTILGSASTDTMSGIGPAPLRRGDLLPVADVPGVPGMAADSGVGLPRPWPDDLPRRGAVTELGVTLGPRDDWFTDRGIATFLDTAWTVTARSNRVGLRLTGAAGEPGEPGEPVVAPTLERANPGEELNSEATVPGSIEVPGNGLPLIFLRDQPVTGGYPVIAVLTKAALVTAGQLPPGAKVRFTLALDALDAPDAPNAPSAHGTIADDAAATRRGTPRPHTTISSDPQERTA